MRVELLFFFCLACLAFTAQAAPASARNALLEQKLARRRAEDTSHDSKHDRHNRHPRQHPVKASHGHHGSGPKRARSAGAEAGVVEEAAARLRGAGTGSTAKHVPEVETGLHDKLNKIESSYREKEKIRKHEIQIEDSIHVAKYGQTPTKFPLITVSEPRFPIASRDVSVGNHR